MKKLFLNKMHFFHPYHLIQRSFAKDDQFDEGELRPDLIDLLFELPISIRDKVEDSGLLAIVEKWSKKRNHSRFVPAPQSDAPRSDGPRVDLAQFLAKTAEQFSDKLF